MTDVRPSPALLPGPTAWVFDADGHVVEPEAMWDRLLPARFRSYAPRVLQFDDHFRYLCNDRVGFRIKGRAESVGAPGQTPHKEASPVLAAGGADPAARLADMAVDRIGVAALYPTYGLMIQGVTERAPAAALCRAINDWLAEYCAHDPQRLLGVGVLPMTDPADALAEARRCVEELGFRGVWRRPEHFAPLPPLHDPGYEALWSYLAEADVPLAIHPGVSGVVPIDELAGRYGDYFSAIHAVHFVMEQMMALTTFVAYGILDRHPGLRVAFLETGATWALAYLHRLDEHLETFGFDQGDLSMKPSELFRRQCFVSAEEVEPGLDAVLAAYPGSVVFASDYPHGDGVFPGSTAELLETDALSPDQVRALLRTNAARLYAVPAADLPGDPAAV
jgi:predicted TIM-barrel fold metal-dependent hydrolase